MNIRIGIQVITVISSEALISYQQVYVNNDYAAEADFERQTNIHKESQITNTLLIISVTNCLVQCVNFFQTNVYVFLIEILVYHFICFCGEVVNLSFFRMLERLAAYSPTL